MIGNNNPNEQKILFIDNQMTENLNESNKHRKEAKMQSQVNGDEMKKNLIKELQNLKSIEKKKVLVIDSTEKDNNQQKHILNEEKEKKIEENIKNINSNFANKELKKTEFTPKISSKKNLNDEKDKEIENQQIEKEIEIGNQSLLRDFLDVSRNNTSPRVSENFINKRLYLEDENSLNNKDSQYFHELSNMNLNSEYLGNDGKPRKKNQEETKKVEESMDSFDRFFGDRDEGEINENNDLKNGKSSQEDENEDEDANESVISKALTVKTKLIDFKSSVAGSKKVSFVSNYIKDIYDSNTGINKGNSFKTDDIKHNRAKFAPMNKGCIKLNVNRSFGSKGSSKNSKKSSKKVIKKFSISKANDFELNKPFFRVAPTNQVGFSIITLNENKTIVEAAVLTHQQQQDSQANNVQADIVSPNRNLNLNHQTSPQNQQKNTVNYNNKEENKKKKFHCNCVIF